MHSEITSDRFQKKIWQRWLVKVNGRFANLLVHLIKKAFPVSIDFLSQFNHVSLTDPINLRTLHLKRNFEVYRRISASKFLSADLFILKGITIKEKASATIRIFKIFPLHTAKFYHFKIFNESELSRVLRRFNFSFKEILSLFFLKIISLNRSSRRNVIRIMK